MNDLTPLALQNHELLQAIYETAFDSIASLADAVGRDRSNVRKSLIALTDAGLALKIDDKPVPRLTKAGIDALSALARASGEVPQRTLMSEPGSPSAETPPGYLTLMHCQIWPDPANPRRDFQSDEALEGIQELADSIAQVGRVLQNLVVRPLPPTDAFQVRDAQDNVLPLYQLVAGERRWRAIGRLIDTDRVPAAFPIPVLVLEIDAAQAERLALIENLKRVDLRPMEEARAFKRLVDGGMSTEAIAVEVMGGAQKQRYVQQRIQLLELDDARQAQVDARALTIKDALDYLRNRPKPYELTDEQTLLFLEVADAIARAGDGFWTPIPVDFRMKAQAEVEGDPVQWLDEFVYFGEEFDTGHTTVKFSYEGRRLLLQLTGSEDVKVKTIEAPLLQARLKAAQNLPEGNPLSAQYIGQHVVVELVTAGGRYFTPYLNKPMLIDPDRKAEAAKRRQAEAERQAGEKARRAEEAEQAKRRVNAAQRMVAIAETLPTAGVQPLVEVMQAYDHPLPWTWLKPNAEFQADLVDANGQEISLDLWDNPALGALVMAAMNAAAGLPPVIGEHPTPAWDAETPEVVGIDPGADEDDGDEDEESYAAEDHEEDKA